MITHFTKIPLFIYFFSMNYIKEYQILLPLICAVFIGTNFGKYILKMSNYSKGEWTQIWDSLYWNFINKNRNNRKLLKGLVYF